MFAQNLLTSTFTSTVAGYCASMLMSPHLANAEGYKDISIPISALQSCISKAKILGLNFDNINPTGGDLYWFSLRKGADRGSEVFLCMKNGDGSKPDWH